MAINKSVFDPRNDDDAPIRGGLDRFLGPPARSYSHMPEDLTDGKTDDEELEAEAQPGQDREPGGGENPDTPLSELKEAVDEAFEEDTGAQPAD